MAELADVQDLGSCGVIRVGSSPTIRTKYKESQPLERSKEPHIFVRLFALYY